MGSPRPNQTSHKAVADAVRRWIVLSTFAPGERLPSERDIAERFSVGRMTVRRAIRDLAAEGLVRTARGRNGGTTVQAPSEMLPDVTLDDLVSTVRISFEFRLAVEPAAAELAAQRATAVERAELRRLVAEQPKSFGEYRTLDSKFHLTVARSSGNSLLLEAVVNSRAHFFGWADAIRRHVGWADLDPGERDFGAHHRTMASAVAAGRPTAARRSMAQHLRTGEEQYHRLVRELAESQPRRPGA